MRMHDHAALVGAGGKYGDDNNSNSGPKKGIGNFRKLVVDEDDAAPNTATFLVFVNAKPAIITIPRPRPPPSPRPGPRPGPINPGPPPGVPTPPATPRRPAYQQVEVNNTGVAHDSAPSHPPDTATAAAAISMTGSAPRRVISASFALSRQ